MRRTVEHLLKDKLKVTSVGLEGELQICRSYANCYVTPHTATDRVRRQWCTDKATVQEQYRVAYVQPPDG
jgi:hypothetical protein